MSQWKTLCRIEDIPRLGARRVRRPGATDIAVFRTADDRVFALLDRCPHKGGPLSQGIVFGDSVACPLHNWTIGLADGCVAAPDEGCVPRFSVRIEGDQVRLDLDELATGGAAAVCQPAAASPAATVPAPNVEAGSAVTLKPAQAAV